MKRMQVLLALTAGTSLLALSPLDAQTRPAPGNPQIQPVRPGGPQIQPPRPVKPTPVRPKPPIQPPRPVKPKPPRPPRPVPVRPVRPIVINWGIHHPGWAYGHAVLFSGNHYGGHHIIIRHNVTDLRRYGFNDRAQSMHARGRWQVCTKVNYRGRCHIVRGSDPLLGRLNGNVTSLRYLGH